MIEPAVVVIILAILAGFTMASPPQARESRRSATHTTQIHLVTGKKHVQSGPGQQTFERNEIVFEDGLYQMHYTLGLRVADDQLLHRFADVQQWQQPLNVRLSLAWSADQQPISHVEIRVNQTSRLSGAAVLEGGVGATNISLSLDAFDTLHLDYEASIYGAKLEVPEEFDWNL